MADSTVGTRLRECREAKGWSTRDLHQRSGVAVPLIEALESEVTGARERLRGMDVVRLCKVLGCGIDWLLHGAVALPPPAGAPVIVFACGRGQREYHSCKECGRTASIQCDAALTAKASRACCDAWLCDRCANVVGKDRHYCGPHYRRAKQLGLALQEGGVHGE